MPNAAASRRLGTLTVSAQGLGCMNLAGHYSGVYDDDGAARSISAVRRAQELGVTFLDTADVYGDGESERLIGRAVAGDRDAYVIATKGGFVFERSARRGGAPVADRRQVDARPEYLRRACEASLQRLGVEAIDLYYLHRAGDTIPIEESVGGLAQLVQEGKVRHLGLSEVSSATVRRAVAVHPIAALQAEWSLFTREIERDVLGTCRELGVGVVAYSPLGKGVLTGRIHSLAALPESDRRRLHPRFDRRNLGANLQIVRRIAQIAAEKGVTVGQLALAWLHHRGGDVVPIPGASRPARVVENADSLRIELTPDEQARIEAAAPPGVAHGARSVDMGSLGR